MFRLHHAQRRIVGHRLLTQWLDCCSVACYSSSQATGSLSSTIRLSNTPAPHVGEITVVSLNRPKARNAISTQLLGELNQIVERLHADGGKSSTRALVLASESDDAFCAGADLKERLTFTEKECVLPTEMCCSFTPTINHLPIYRNANKVSIHSTRDFLKSLRGTFHRLSTLPIPTISAISSSAFGGGLELALCTNFRVFASTATVGLPETRLGIIPGAGGTFRLPALIGETRARDMILTGRRISGPEAYFLGLCDRLVEITQDEAQGPGVARGKVLEQALSMATLICEGGPVAIKAGMQAVNGWQKGEVSENAAYETTIPSQDRKEALQAFGEKRKPVFRGR